MGLFDKLFNKEQEKVQAETYFKMLTGYRPVFHNWNGQIYESELVRAAIDARSRHISKLKIETVGSGKPVLQNKFKVAPNYWQTWSQFLYRTNTILDIANTAFIVPILDQYDEVSGIYTIWPQGYELVDVNGEAWIRFIFDNGDKAAIELHRVGILTKYQFKSDFFGENNDALRSTMELIHIQNEGITEAVKNSATYRFMASIENFTKAGDLKKERERFNESSFLDDSGGGLLLFPNTYKNVKQIDSKPYTVDFNQMKLIQDNVFNYYGVNENVLQNKANTEEMDAFYNGCIEPFAIQLEEVLTKMIFTRSELGHGSRFYISTSRLQYMTTKEKLSFAQALGDRGALYIDEIRAMFNYEPLKDGLGEHIPIRGEYYFLDVGKEAMERDYTVEEVSNEDNRDSDEEAKA